MRARVALLALVAALSAAPAARAGDPIMPLSEVRAGMRCTGLSVIRGTEVASFDVEVLDVVGPTPVSGASILVRVSGPAVDATGVASGFSGSPVYCPDGQGTPRNIGAIAFSLGEYGNKTVLATPIERILGEPVVPPAGARAAGPRERGARPLRSPLTVSGLPPAVARAAVAAGRRAGRQVVTSPGPPALPFAPQRPAPGSSLSVSLSSGDVGLSVIGTVAYTDGDSVWAFGHSIGDTGRRSLLMQDAYVYTVIGSPLESDQTRAYKLAAPVHDLGTITNDAQSAVAGRLGPLPALVPFRLLARDGDTGDSQVAEARLADETALDFPDGVSAPAAGGTLLVASAGTSVLGSFPLRLSGAMCARIALRELRAPLRFCNTYAGNSDELTADELGLSGVVGLMAADYGQAMDLIDNYEPRPLHVRRIDATLTLRRGLNQALMLSARAPRVARAGRRIRVLLRVQRPRGSAHTLALRVRVPPTARGRRVLTLRGTPLDGGDEEAESFLEELADALRRGSGEGGGGDEEPVGPRTLPALARAVAAIARFDGITASFGGRARTAVYRNRGLRISGTLRIPLRVVP